jgi:DNA-binding NarL/FixJ family response regulator
VVGEGRWVDAQTFGAEVIVALDDEANKGETAQHAAMAPALVLVSDRPPAVRRAATSGATGWAVIPTAASAEDLVAAANAAERGFAVAHPTRLTGAGQTRSPDWDDELPEERLTPREQEILELVAQGQSNRRIAATLGISEHTVKFHLASIYGKLGASTRTEAVRRGLRRGLIEI